MPVAGLTRERPFPGLRPFGPNDREYFFGREEQISALYRLLDRNRFIAVVGSSGSGKSSLVLAGLIPLLEDESREQGGRAWRFTTMRPGDAPLAALADALVGLAGDGERVDEATLRERIEFTLRRSSFGLMRALDFMPSISGAPVVLVVDQFEELFRHARSIVSQDSRDPAWREEAVNFVQLLLEASRDRTRSVHVLITMRSDFIGDCAQFYDLPEAVSAAQFLVPSLTRDQREAVIRRPIEKAEGTIDPAVVQRLLNDASGELDQLPVLQHCLARLWYVASKRGTPVHITESDYADVHMVAGALSQHADEVMSSLAGLEPVVEKVFRSLSEVDSEGRATRRALSFERLLAETGVPADQLRTVLDRFRADDCSFIVPSLVSVPVLQPNSRIDVVHEALLRRWEKITPPADESLGEAPKGWLAAEAADGRFYRGLLALLESGRDATLPLELVEEREKWWRDKTRAWTERYGGKYDRVDRLFRASRAALDAENARQAEQKRLEEQIAVNRRRARQTLVGVIAVAVAISIGWAVYAFQWRNEAIGAEKSAFIAQARATNMALTAKSASEDALAQRRAAALLKRQAAAAQRAAIRAQAAALAQQKRALTAAALARADENREAQARAAAMASEQRLHEQTIALSQLRIDAGRKLAASQATAQKAMAEENNARASWDYNAAVIAERDADWPTAITDYNLVLNFDPKVLHAGDFDLETESYSGRAWAEYQTRKIDAAITDFKKALAIDPKNGLANYRLGRVYQYTGDYDKAVPLFSSAIAAGGSSQKVSYYERGYSYLMLADFDRTIEDATAALKVDTRYASGFELRGEALARQGQYDKAIADFTQAVNNDPKDYWAFQELGMAYIATGRYREAITVLVHAEDIDPTRAYPALIAQVARWKLAASGTAEFAAMVQYVDLGSWPNEVVQLVLGKITLDKLLADVKGNDLHACDADYYGAEYLLAKGDLVRSRALFSDAMRACAKGYPEYAGAQAELARLGPQANRP